MLLFNRSFLLTWFLLINVSAYSQFPQFHFENITTVSGLSSNDITCLYQDHEGFLWIGTHFGLNRYDGNQVETFYHENENPNSLSGNDIVDILEDQQNIFWIATKDGGLTRYDPSQLRSNQFRQFRNNPSNKNSIATNRLTCLFDYSNDYLLVGSEVCTGFFLNKKTFQIGYVDVRFLKKSYLDPSKTLAAPSGTRNWIHRAYKSDSSIYISFLIGGYVYKADKNDQSINIPFSGTSSSLAYSIPSFVIDGNNAWLSSWSNGLILQKGLLSDTTRIPVQKRIININDQILSVNLWNENYLLAGSKATGLYIVNKKNYSFTNLRHDRSNAFTIASNKINCIYKDRNGILWIGTSAGLSKYNPLEWQFHSEPLSSDPDIDLTQFSVHQDGNGTIRVCTSEGIYEKKAEEKSFHLHRFTFRDNPVSPTYIYQSSHGNFYMCSERSFFTYNPQKETIDTIRIDHYGAGLPISLYNFSFQFRSVMEDTVDGHPVLVFGILGDGLGFYDSSTFHYYYLVNFQEIPRSIPDNLIHVVTKDNSGNIWVGTANGLCRWKKSYPPQNDFISYLNIPGKDSTISGNNISGIFVDQNDHLWITTIASGLNEFDGKIFHHYFTQDAPGNNMVGIYQDDQNRLWIPSSNGFDVFDRDKKTFDEVVVPDPEWILQYPARMLKRPDGSFCYGAGNYFISFNPDSFYFDESKPKVYLTDFKVMDKSIFETAFFSKLNFPYNKNFFTINFSSLLLSQSSKVEYQYKLEGLNNKWINAGGENQASFTSLPAGRYTFKVKATGANGIWGNEVSLVSFSVMKPFWNTWWFALFCTAIAVLIVYVIFQIRLRQLMRLQEIRHRIATDLHDDIGSALSSISISSQLVKKFSDHDEEKVDKILNRISTTSRETLESMSDIVWAINPKNDTGKNMIMKMQRVASDLLESKGIKVHFDYDDNFGKMKLGMEGRKNLFLIFKEAVNNVSKHSGCNEAHIRLNFQNHHLSMKIEDDGKGFTVTKSSLGNGMESIRHRSDQLGAKLNIESTEGKGTRIILNVDLTKIRD